MPEERTKKILSDVEAQRKLEKWSFISYNHIVCERYKGEDFPEDLLELRGRNRENC